MRRGDIWRYAPPGSPRERLVVIVSADGVNNSERRWLVGAEVVGDNPGDLLAVPTGAGREWWVCAADLSRVYRPWLTVLEGCLDAVALERLDTALRASLDL